MNARRVFALLAFTLALIVLDIPRAAAQSIDQNFYYKLSTQFRGVNWKLDVFNGGPNNNLTRLELDQDVSGQFWRFTQNADGTFRLTTLFRGPNVCLDIFNGGPNNNQPHLANCANLSGQLWTLTKTTRRVPGNYTCAHCNDGSCQCGNNSGAELCANHKGADPTIGCTQQQ